MRNWHLILPLCALALTACVKPEDTATRSQPKPLEVSSKAAWQNKLMAAAGYNIPASETVAQNAATTNDMSVGLTVTAAKAGVGALSNFQSGLLGFVTFIGSPPAGKEAWDGLIFTTSTGTPKTALEQQVQRTVYRMTGRNFESEGFKKTSRPWKPHLHGYVQPGCKSNGEGWYKGSCQVLLYPNLTRVGDLNGQAVYVGDINGATGKGFFYSVYPSTNQDRVLPQRKALADALRGTVHVYVAPRRSSGAWSQPAVYSRGSLRPL